MNSDVGEIFGSRAHEYDRYAKIQHTVASDLAGIMARALDFTPQEKVMDLGCGTGDLICCLRPYCHEPVFYGCDLSSDMLAEACLKISGIIPLTADFNQSDFLKGGKYDLIMSSFAFQWCRDLPCLFDYLSRSITPSGAVALALPVAGSLSELKESFAEIGYGGFINDFPAESLCTESLQRVFGGFYGEVRTYTVRYPSCRDILRSITRIGAAGRFSSGIVNECAENTETGGGTRLTPGIVKDLIRVYEKYSSADGGYEISYRVLFAVAGTFRKSFSDTGSVPAGRTDVAQAVNPR